MHLKPQIRPVIAFILVLSVSACAQDSVKPENSAACSNTSNLMDDVRFADVNGAEGPWRYAQHAGEKSFAISSIDGVMQIERISGQPWMLLRQTVESSDFAGATVQFSAELKGDVPAEPRLHGFEHKAGLYLNIGNRKDPVSADHEPNSGVWDWQKVSVNKVVPAGESSVHIGFLHQSGGTLWVRNPMLTISDCGSE